MIILVLPTKEEVTEFREIVLPLLGRKLVSDIICMCVWFSPSLPSVSYYSTHSVVFSWHFPSDCQYKCQAFIQLNMLNVIPGIEDSQ